MTNRKLEYIPKGGMCATCISKEYDCSTLDFSAMPRISKGDRDGIVIVRCTAYEKGHTATPDCWCKPVEVEPGIFLHRRPQKALDND